MCNANDCKLMYNKNWDYYYVIIVCINFVIIATECYIQDRGDYSLY